jgi:hypothetical protein
VLGGSLLREDGAGVVTAAAASVEGGAGTMGIVTGMVIRDGGKAELVAVGVGAGVGAEESLTLA